MHIRTEIEEIVLAVYIYTRIYATVVWELCPFWNLEY